MTTETSKSQTVLGWKELYVDLRVTDAFPTEKFAEFVKSAAVRGDSISTLDFSGIQQLTDEAFLALKKVVIKTKLRDTIVKVDCTGCVHLTDLGVLWLAQALPALNSVCFAGCRQLSSVSLCHLQRHCNQLTNIDLTSTCVSWLPQITETISLVLDGCPLLPQDVGNVDVSNEMLTDQCTDTTNHKILVSLFCDEIQFNVVDFLARGNISDSADTSPFKKLDYSAHVKFPKMDDEFNIFQCHSNINLLSLLLSAECICVIVIDMNGPSYVDNPQLHIMNRITAIRAKSPYSGVVLLGVHDDITESEAAAELKTLVVDLDNFMKEQSETLDSHLQHDSFDSALCKVLDFSSQLRYCRAFRASQNLCQLYAFTVNKDTSYVTLRWPEADSADDKQSDEEDDEMLNPKQAARLKWLAELESAKNGLKRLSKSDIVELRSMKQPPETISKILEAMSIMLTNDVEQSSSYRTLMANYTFLTDMINLPVDKVSDEVVFKVQNILADLNIDDKDRSRLPPIVLAVRSWLNAVQGFIINCLADERAELELKEREQRWEKRQKQHARSSKGPSAILRVFRSIIASIHDQKYLDRKFRANYSSCVKQIEALLTSCVDDKILTLSEFMSKNIDGKYLATQSVKTVLQWLTVQGKLLWFANISGQPLVTNISWFIDFIGRLCDKTTGFQPNGSRCKALPPTQPFIDLKSFTNVLGDVTPDKMKLVLDLLVGYGVLIRVPVTSPVQLAEHSSEDLYYMFIHTADKPFIRTGLNTGYKSFVQFKENYWPTVGMATWNETDFSFSFHFSFAVNFPVNFIARVINEWTELGAVSLVWRDGVLARVGAIEILLRHDIHGTLMCNSLIVEARVTQGLKADMIDNTVLPEYFWAAVSKYLLVIEYLADQYPEVHVMMSMACKGSCSDRGIPGMIPVSEIPRKLDVIVRCSECDGVPAQLAGYFTGRQHFLPFHEWLSSSSVSDINFASSPYSHYCARTLSAEHEITACLYCGTVLQASLRLWKMESELFPSFVTHSAKFLELPMSPEHRDLFQLQGNLVSVGPVAASSEIRHLKFLIIDGVSLTCKLSQNLLSCGMDHPYYLHPGSVTDATEDELLELESLMRNSKPVSMLLLFLEPLYASGFTQVDVTVVESGSVQLLVGQDFCSRVDSSKLDVNRSHVRFNLQTGELNTRDILTKGFPLKLAESGPVIGKGDTLTLEAIANRTVLVHDPEFPEVEMSYLVVEIHLLKNGRMFFSGLVRHRSNVGLLLDAGKDLSQQLVLSAPQYPHVKSHNFPLGSSVLCRARSGQQWSVGRIVSTAEDDLLISIDETDSAAKLLHLPPCSVDLLPVGQYADGTSILLGKEPMKNSVHMIKYLRSLKAWPAPFALFHSVPDRIKEQFIVLNLKANESKWCAAGSNFPEVLEQVYERFMSSRGKNQRQRNDVSVILLPADITLTSLLNPVRHLAHNWQRQQIYFICKGTEWTTKLSYQRDTHFLDIKPANVGVGNIALILQDMASVMLLAYYCMEYRQNILPFPLETFPDIDSSLPVEELVEGLSRIMVVYRSTLLLIQAMIGIQGKANKSKVKSDCALFLLKTLTDEGGCSAYAPSAIVRSIPSEGTLPSGVCMTHNFISKRTGIREIINMPSPSLLTLSTHDSHALLKYASTVQHISMTGEPIVDDQLKKLLRHFPFLEGLSLTDCNISSLAGISLCLRLRHLHVRGHCFDELPAEMASLQRLWTLEISSGTLRCLPPFIGEFSELRVLNLCNTLVSELPAEIGQLTRLVALDLGRCPVSSLPDSLRKLRNMESLRLHGIPIVNSTLTTAGDVQLTRDKFDKHLRFCTALSSISQQEVDNIWKKLATSEDDSLGLQQQLQLNHILLKRFPRFGQNYIAGDCYGGIPPQIFSLFRLRSLSITSQAIRFIPRHITSLSRLSKLMLNDNLYLEEVHSDLGQCPLKVLNLTNCPQLRTPPKEIREQGMKTIIAYLKRLSQGSRAIFQTKLMVVGLGGVGKTSLVRALMSIDNKATTSEETDGITNGIDISNWSINRYNQTLTFNVWDFAGQTVYYNTHQFFLSSRAVYILAWNTRLGHEHAGLDFWLSSIACHCPGVPVLVVGTHADQITNPELPVEQLSKRFSNIAGFFTVSAITGQGMKEMMDRLIQVTLKQPYIGEMVPEAWLSLERAILSKRNQVSLLDWNILEGLAQSASIYGPEVNQAISFLHDLGTLQHFKHELLRDKVVISPQWIVDVMACVVSVQNTTIKGGRLEHKDIGVIWKAYPKEMHKWLLKLTEVFDLSFPLPDRPENIVPCLLSPNEPELNWPQVVDGVKQTKVLYKFVYLPAGLFNRTQVRLYEFSDSSAIWKAGSLLKKNGHTALIARTSENTMMVRVHGTRPDNLLLMVHEVIEGLINDFFTGIEYKYEVPCPHCLTDNVSNPTLFSSKTLRRAVEQRALFIQCHKRFHTLSVSEVQAIMLPQSMQDYDVQLQRDMFDLAALSDQRAYDLCFLYCNANIPDTSQQDKVIHPRTVCQDLVADGYLCWFPDNLTQLEVGEVAKAITSSKLIVVFISNEFVADPVCRRYFHFFDDNLQKNYVLVMVGTGREWLQSQIGIRVAGKVFVNMQNINVYADRLGSLREQIQQKLQPAEVINTDVFISYCWLNSELAVNVGQARRESGALGNGDPRQLKQFLEDNGVTCWLDIDKVGRMGLFEDIADGMKNSKVVVACISDEYVKSDNCKMEFRFAHISLKKPIILAVVGTGFKWETTEIGMLSLNYPKVNYQLASETAHKQLLTEVKDQLLLAGTAPASSKPLADISKLEKEKAAQELYEVIQRKFLRQLNAYTDNLEPFPQLFVFDFCNDLLSPDSSEHQQIDADEDDKTSVQTDNSPGDIFDEIQSRPLCLKILCEYESGWHCVDEGLSIDLNGFGWLDGSLWEQTAAYMARVLAIVKHSDIQLRLFSTSEGDRLLKALQNLAGADSLSQVQRIYLALRKYAELKDQQHRYGSLKRCYMPSGKYLWLCPKHRISPRICVLPDPEIDVTADSQMLTPEAVLLQLLSNVERINVTDAVSRLAKVRKVSDAVNKPRRHSPHHSPLRQSPRQSPHQSRSASPKPTTTDDRHRLSVDIQPAARRAVRNKLDPADETEAIHNRRKSLEIHLQPLPPDKDMKLIAAENIATVNPVDSRQTRMNLAGMLSAGVNQPFNSNATSETCILL